MSRFGKTMRTPFGGLKALLLAALLLLAVAAPGLAVPPPELPPGQCPVCGMDPAQYPAWQAQVAFGDGQTAAFDGCKDLFRFLLQVPNYDPHHVAADVSAVWVKDHTTGNWTDGRQAVYLTGSDLLGPMGKELVPFADAAQAKAFAAEHGGEVIGFDQVTLELLAQLGPAGHHHHGAHEPIGVMGGHIHSRGEWMAAYDYMHMSMDGNRSGSHRVSTGEVLQDFMVAPLDMSMDMHMFALMYAPSDRLTLMAMVPYLHIEMRHQTRTGVRFSTHASGLGDVKVSALYLLLANPGQRLHLTAGLSLPSGSIDRRDDTPAGPDQKLPYPMQLGSGTYDLLPGLTYSGQSGAWSWGGQAQATLRLGENSNDYTLGNRYEATAWAARRLVSGFSASLRLDGQHWGEHRRRRPRPQSDDGPHRRPVPTRRQPGGCPARLRFHGPHRLAGREPAGGRGGIAGLPEPARPAAGDRLAAQRRLAVYVVTLCRRLKPSRSGGSKGD